MSKDLYVRHIPAAVTEDDLRRLFAVCGKVTYIHMVRDTKSGEFVGCAFVKMSSEAEAKDALVTLDGARLINREISVTAARPQPPKGAPKKAQTPQTEQPAPGRSSRPAATPTTQRGRNSAAPGRKPGGPAKPGSHGSTKSGGRRS